MSDWRKVEAELVHLLDVAGVEIIREGGDCFAVVASLECQNPSKECKIVIGPYGKTECELCEVDHNLNGRITTLRITEIAKRLSNF